MPLNPYESPVVAELVERPMPSARKRHPLLAVLFLIFDVPLVAVSVMAVAGGLTNSSITKSEAAVILLFMSPLLALPWLVLGMCLKELIQFGRRR